MDNKKEEKKETKATEAETRSPLTQEDIAIVTELANIGLKFIKGSMIPSLTAKKDEQQLKYAQFLASVGGDTVQKFDTICHYLLDAEKKEDAKDTSVEKKSE